VEQVINDALRRGLTSGGHAWPARYRVDFGRFPQLRWVNPIAR
jgi:hypothetical protein